MDEATLARVEEQRLQLESSIAALRNSLRHWQTLEIDYEGLREEFLLLPDSASPEQCVKAAVDFSPELVGVEEIQGLLTDRSKGHKTPSQLVDLFAKRVDYVQRNIATIRKQLSDAEKKRNALLLAENPEYQDDAGLPLKEITEELDADGAVVSSKVQAPGAEASNLIDVLRKAGVTDIKDGGDAGTKDLNSSQIEAFPSDIGEAVRKTDKVSQIPVADPDNNITNQVVVDSDESNVEDDEDERLEPTNPNDTEEDAALRQEMLQYGLGEVGAIVAELDLLEGESDISYDDIEHSDDNIDEFSDYDEDEESEDERGAAKAPIISDSYKRKMEALQNRFGVDKLQNLGPNPPLSGSIKEQLDRPSAAEAARRAALARAEAVPSVLKHSADEPKQNSSKKRVAFAQGLDIAEEKAAKSNISTEATPLNEVVIERNSQESAGGSVDSTAPPKKLSKFKASRMSSPQTSIFPPTMKPSMAPKPTPEGPAGKIISADLVERSAAAARPPNSTEFDEELHRREVATEFQKFRNRKIHEQGGYVQGGEQENYGEEFAPLSVDDEITGKPRKISRFKAARINS